MSFIDNRDGNTLERTLRESLSDAPLSIATAFFTPAGLLQIEGALSASGDVRLLIGTEPPRHMDVLRRNPGETAKTHERRLLQESQATATDAFLTARDQVPFTPETHEKLSGLVELARTGRLRARRYTDRFLHAKAFLSGTRNGGHILAGSGNVTVGGLSRNLELTLGRDDTETVRTAHDWFDDLWDDAEEWDIAEWLGALLETYTPFDVYIRMLLEAYGDDLDAFEQEIEGLNLTTFQRHGVAQALRIMRQRGGAIVADEVGLGKTYIAGEIMRLYHDRRQRVLLVCPATLRDGTWKQFLAEHKFDVSAEVVSYEQLAADKQLGGDKKQLERPLDEYQLVVVDEAHNYRNPAAETRAQVLHRLLQGRQREVLLLTATPVNNSIWDLYHAIRMFIRQDAGLADVGVISLRDKFRRANALEPSELNPDHLFSVIDATCVKRTRQFVKEHYGDDRIFIGGKEQSIVFPKAKAMTVRYSVDGGMTTLFDLVETYLDPVRPETLRFARYNTESYKLTPDPDANIAAAIGLLRSGLLKRAESSVVAFARTLGRMIDDHETFVAALDHDRVPGTRALREISGSDEADFADLVEAVEAEALDLFDAIRLRADAEADLEKLHALHEAATAIAPQDDPKLTTLLNEIEAIHEAARRDGVSADDIRRNGKVLIFSYYADTVEYVRDCLNAQCTKGALATYSDRIAAVGGSVESGVDQVAASSGFAPVATGGVNAEDLYDILISTDVLAEGVNLQDCRNVINFDLPWNPMRLVQRHGRVDRIGSPHDVLFLRTIFPAERLDNLLNIEARILNKITVAARSIGVSAPVEAADDGIQSFASTRNEIENLLNENPTLYERGGTVQMAQTAEQYRQTLRKALERNGLRYQQLPRTIGSGMARGKGRGVVICARIDSEVQFVFVPCNEEWKPIEDNVSNEIASCLRAVECDINTPVSLPSELLGTIYDVWDAACGNMVGRWNHLSDPKNIQPRVDRLNRLIAEFLRTHREGSSRHDTPEFRRAIEIVETPWDQREKNRLSDIYKRVEAGEITVNAFVEFILGAGVQPYQQPKLRKPISIEDIQLTAWMAVGTETEASE